MKKRPFILLSAGAAFLAISYFTLPLAFGWLLAPSKPGERIIYLYANSAEQQNGLAPLQFWRGTPPEHEARGPEKRAVRLLLIRGQAFIGDVLLPREEIKDYLDARVKSGEIEYVVVLPAKDTKWGDIFPVIDECRKSRVRLVLLNRDES
jgi:hypothetical protein